MNIIKELLINNNLQFSNPIPSRIILEKYGIIIIETPNGFVLKIPKYDLVFGKSINGGHTKMYDRINLSNENQVIEFLGLRED